MQNKLPIHEWLAVFGFIAILFALGALSLFRGDPILHEYRDQIQVKVTGLVENPGYHFLPPGATLKELSPIVKPLPDTKPNISASESLKDGQTIRYKSSLVTVHIKGAVSKPTKLKLKLGSHFSDALDQLEIEPDADIAKVQNRLIKRNQQTITIPRKK